MFRARAWGRADRVGLPGGVPPIELRTALLELLSQVVLRVLWELAIGRPSPCLRERFLGPQPYPPPLGRPFRFLLHRVGRSALVRALFPSLSPNCTFPFI